MAEHKIDGNDGAGNVQAPERIWASNRTNGNCVVSFTSRSEEYSIEYIRADVAEAELAAMTAIRDKPAPAVLPLLPDMVDAATAAGVVVWWDNEAQEIKMAVTVQEAARVLLDQPYGVMSVAFDAMEKLHGEGADRVMAAALRAIAPPEA